ncbi:MAG: alpha/beta fold hydrolase [Actinobacteria bacterium]|nr:alpha/beta fold hydrolase [Actinomycetota bacterium]
MAARRGRGPGTTGSAALAAVPAPTGPRPPASGPQASVRHTARALAGDLGALLTPRGLRGVALEASWGAAHLAMYPWGLLRERPRDHDRYHLGGLDPAARGMVVGDVEAAGTPILLIHGMVDNRAIFTVLRRRLRRRGFRRVVSLNYSPMTNDVRLAARDLSGAVEELVARTGYERIHVVGHSLGGLIARYYVQRLGGDERVHTLVTLGTPHEGTLPARLVPVELCRQLSPGSDFYAELAEPAAGCRTRFVAYWSDLDQMILPHENGRLEHPDLAVRNVLVRGRGHMSIPIDGDVVHGISTLLGQLDPDGTTLHAGVTPIAAGR